MKKKFNQIILLLILSFSIFPIEKEIFAQKGIIGVSNLMLTKYPCDTTEVIRLLHKGDTIEIIWSLTNSIKVAFRGSEGFVGKELLTNNNFYVINDSIKYSKNLEPILDTISYTKMDSSLRSDLSRLDSVMKSETNRNIALSVFSDSVIMANKLAIEKNKSEKVNEEEMNRLKSEKEPLGFKNGFLFFFGKSFLPVLIIVAILTTKKGVKDGRYKSGFRPAQTDGLLVIFLTGIICSLIGLCGGIFYWGSLFFK